LISPSLTPRATPVFLLCLFTVVLPPSLLAHPAAAPLLPHFPASCLRILRNLRKKIFTHLFSAGYIAQNLCNFHAPPPQNTPCRSGAETPSEVEGSAVEGRKFVLTAVLSAGYAAPKLCNFRLSLGSILQNFFLCASVSLWLSSSRLPQPLQHLLHRQRIQHLALLHPPPPRFVGARL